MALKICFKNYIHRCSEPPVDLTALKKIVTSSFSTSLPPAWSLYYIDSEDDQITLFQDDCYRDFLRSELQGASKIIKIYVAEEKHSEPPKSPIKELNSENSSLAQSQASQSEESKSLMDLRGNAQSIQSIQSSQSVESYKHSSNRNNNNSKQVQREGGESLKIENKGLGDIKKESEIQSKANFLQFGNGSEIFGKSEKIQKAKELFKRLVTGQVSDAEKSQVLEKISMLEQSLTFEQKEAFTRKKEKIMQKIEKLEQKREQDLKELNDQAQKSIAHNGKPIHLNTTCENCGMSPIVGVRYKCSQCKSFDYCEICEDALDHDHPFLKLKTSSILWKKVIKIKEEKDRKKPYNVYEALGELEKLVDAMYRGETENVETYRQKLRLRLQEGVKDTIEPLLEIIIKEKDDDKIEKTIDEARAKLVTAYSKKDSELKRTKEQPKIEERRKEEPLKLQESRKEDDLKLEKRRKEEYESKRGSKKWMEYASAGRSRHEKKYRNDDYPKPVITKALRMKEILREADLEDLKEFVFHYGKKYLAEELVVIYKEKKISK